MIKNTTVFKRMFAKAWKPALVITSFTVAISAASIAAEKYLGWDFNNTYWGLFFVLFVSGAIKSFYDWQKMELKFEQERMMRDLGKKND